MACYVVGRVSWPVNDLRNRQWDFRKAVLTGQETRPTMDYVRMKPENHAPHVPLKMTGSHAARSRRIMPPCAR